MKKLLLSVSAVALTMLAFTFSADAGHKVRYLAGYDSCGRPVYCYKYVPTCYGSSGYRYGHIQAPSYRTYGHSPSHNYRPSYGHSGGHGYSHSYSRGRSYCR